MSDKTGIEAIEELIGNIRGNIPGATFRHVVENSFRFSGANLYRDAYADKNYSLNGIVDWLDLAVSDARGERNDEIARLKERIADLENRSWSQADIEAMGYMKLPVGKDGKPIRTGETVYGQDGKAWYVKHVGTSKHCINGVNGREMRQMKACWLTHEPPNRYPLDADGVECRPGDTVWFGGKRAKVDSIDGNSNSIAVTFSDGSVSGADAGLFTHVEPDSWEKLERDARKEYASEYWGCGEASCWECPSKIDGETPKVHYKSPSCILAARSDIVRRAKALAGVEGGDAE